MFYIFNLKVSLKSWELFAIRVSLIPQKRLPANNVEANYNSHRHVWS